MPLLLAFVACVAIAVPAAAQAVHGVVVDQTELPLPGARVELIRGGAAVVSTVTAANGTFELPDVREGDLVQVSLDGFETIAVPPARASRVVLALGRATETTEVHASPLQSSGAAMEHVGSSLTSAEMLKMPVPHPRALEALPRLPSVVRGPDGVLHIGGTLPHTGALLIDGFDVTDPVSGFSALDLPVEAVKGVAVIRDPMSVSFGQTLGGLASIETVAGPDRFTAGVQGFIPRPRLSSLGFGRIEAFFPRAYVAGRKGPIRFFAAQELSFERVPVPGVTTHSGTPNIGEQSTLTFGRLDLEISARHAVTLEGIFVPGHRDYIGLSPVRDQTAAPFARTQHLFAGVIDRLLFGTADVVTTRFGIVSHGTVLSAQQQGVARLTPYGWRDSWFSNVDHWSARQTLAVQWDHTAATKWGAHLFTSSIEAQRRAIQASFAHNPIRVEDVTGRAVRTIDFGAPVWLNADEFAAAGLVRDLWDLSPRVQLDAGVRVDWYSASGDAVPSPRLGIRYRFEDARNTIVKAGVGRFVGRMPIASLVFGSFPPRVDATVEGAPGETGTTQLQGFTVGGMRLPRADSVVLEMERALGLGIEGQVAFRQRVGSALPTVDVPQGSGVAALESTGTSTYRELAFAVRRSWGARAQALVSYVHASSTSELNDFGTLFTNMDTPLLQPGGQARTADEVPHRLLAWATVSLPRKIVVSPALDWHTGFPFSRVDAQRRYVGTPNSVRLPPSLAIDLTVYKGFDIKQREVNLGLQVFNLTGHFNPRDAYAVIGTPGPPYTNSVGRTFGGYMVVRWESGAPRPAPPPPPPPAAPSSF